MDTRNRSQVTYRRVKPVRVPVTRTYNVTPIEAGLIATLLGVAGILGWSIAAAGFALPGL